MIYVFMGPPGAGKSTQSKRLAKSLHIPIYSVSDELHALAKTDAALQDFLDHGNVVPIDYIDPILRTIHKKCKESCILDGIPRSGEQVDMLIRYWSASKVTGILLEVPDVEVFDRMKKRAEEDHGRRDDTPDIMRHRVSHYRAVEPEIVHSIDQQAMRLIRIDGMHHRDVVQDVILRILEG